MDTNDLKNAPVWMQGIPPLCAAAVGLYGAANANKMIVIIGMPIGLLIGFGILTVLLKKQK